MLTQDFQIFPGLVSSKLLNERVGAPPAGVEELAAKAADGTLVKIWKLSAQADPARASALLFHGNGENVATFVAVQNWLSILGLTSYSVEYRGYDGSDSGWPTEEGFYSDAEAALALMQQREQVAPGKIVVIGSSIGSGIASYIAQKHNVGTLVLLSPYTSLPAVAAELPVFGFLAPFLKFKFATEDRVPQLTSTCLVLAHGKKDYTIPFSHSQRLKELYRGTSAMHFIESAEAGHNDLIRNTHEQIAASIDQCLAAQSAK